MYEGEHLQVLLNVFINYRTLTMFEFFFLSFTQKAIINFNLEATLSKEAT